MATGKVTKRSVDAVVPGERDQLLWDEELRGFGLKSTPKGAKSYILQYRMGGREAPTRRYTIGTHGSPWTPLSARMEAERLLRMVCMGDDPRVAERRRRNNASTLAFDDYAERYLKDFGSAAWRPRTYKGVASNLRRHAMPVLGSKALPSVTRADIAAVLDQLPAGKPALPRNIFTHLKKLFSWAVERGDLDRSPFDGLRTPRAVASRERVLTNGELKLAWEAAGSAGQPFGSMVRLLIATGQRREEAAGMDWREVHQQEAEWIIPSGRAKNGKEHRVPLNSLSIFVLNEMAGSSNWPARGLVFSTTGRTSFSGFSRAKRRLDQVMLDRAQGAAARSGKNVAEIELEPWRLHDIRRTTATGLQRLGVRFEVTEAVLNHVGGSRSGVAGVYQRHNWLQEKREALQLWGRFVESLTVSNVRTT